MAKLAINLPDDLARRVREAAKAANMSVSGWVAQRVSDPVNPLWSPAFLSLAGAFPDFPDAGELRKGYGPDVARESLD
jgi:hypothetical protein